MEKIELAGGVMSNSIIKEHIIKKYGAYFALPEYSSDNAGGNGAHNNMPPYKVVNIWERVE